MLLPRLAFAVLLAFPLPALSETSGAETSGAETSGKASVSRLADVLQLDALFVVLRDEGLAYGDAVETDLLAGGGGPGWKVAVSAVYDVAKLRAQFDAALAVALADDPEALTEIIAFFSSDLGQRIVGLEIEARRAFLDVAKEEAARVAVDTSRAGRDPKVALIAQMIAASDLIEMNVAGGLTGNLAFMTGMNETGSYGPALPPDALMSEVWAQEEQIRAETTSWLQAYLGLAYFPLTEAELSTYVAFWESPAGQHLNAALFTAFDAVFREVFYDLGRATGLAMVGRDI
jgi:hypothetical protein